MRLWKNGTRLSNQWKEMKLYRKGKKVIHHIDTYEKDHTLIPCSKLCVKRRTNNSTITIAKRNGD
jgi:hypothetical protein